MSILRIGLIIDEAKQTYLNYDLYRRSLDSEYYSIEYLIVQKSKEVHNDLFIKKLTDYIKRRGFKKFIARLVFAVVDKIETFFVKKNSAYKDLFLSHPISEFKVPLVYVQPMKSESGLVFTYKESDLNMIRELDLDVLVHGGSGILRGDILEVCQFGIISFHHANNDINRGGPPGFWEVYNRESSTGFVIQRLLSELDGGDVLFRGNIATSFFYKLNACRLYIKSSVFLNKTLEQIAIKREIVCLYPKSPYCYPLYTIPTVTTVFIYLFKTFSHGFKKIIGKLMRKSNRWAVAYHFTDNWKSAVLWKSKVIKNPPHRFLADPFVITQNNQTVVYVEDYDYRVGRGKISAFEINSLGSKELGVAIEEDFHLSYPFLFRVGDELYMTPETQESKDIRIYRCNKFPLKWELHKVIMSDVSAVDTNIFKFDNKFWMMTNIDSSELGDRSSELHIFYSDSFDSTKWQPHPMNPVIFDSMCARNGGLILSEDSIYRVFQVQGFDMYGVGMGISKVTILNTNKYKEEVLFDIPARFFKNIRGAHTFSFESGVLCIDFVKYENYKN